MPFYIVKIAVTTVLVVLISEISKRSTLLAAILASVPLVSVLAMIWLYAETAEPARVSAFAGNVAWLVLPSLVLFLLLPALLERGYHFYFSLTIATTATIISYYFVISLARHLELRFG
jgi:cobalamin synthase